MPAYAPFTLPYNQIAIDPTKTNSHNESDFHQFHSTMPSTRSGKRRSSTVAKKTTKKSKQTTTNATSNSNDISSSREEDNENTQDRTEDGSNPKKSSTIFQSRFPGLELDTFEDELDNWTLIELQEAILSQGSRRSTAPKDIKKIVQVVRLEFEKRILMIALMAGVPEIVIWNLV